jgi:hypothetical protein
MNNSVRENAVSWAEKVAAHDQRKYLVSNTRIMDMMKDMMEHSNKMASETEKNQAIVGKIFAIKFVPEPVKKPSIYERIYRMF